MANNNVFKRYELKYLLDPDQTRKVMEAVNEHMTLDKYGHSLIKNIYLDTDTYLLARRSIEKPLYKEKLRFRCYGQAGDDTKVFVELKKKCESVVYKRRVSMPLNKAMEWFTTDTQEFPHTQIGMEIDYMREKYLGIRPAMLLCYEREAFYPKDRSFLRITFDTNITARTEDIDLRSSSDGKKVLPDGYTLMEIKTLYGYPAWLNKVLSENRIYKTSFSKYGTAYQEQILGIQKDQLFGLNGCSSLPAVRMTVESDVCTICRSSSSRKSISGVKA